MKKDLAIFMMLVVLCTVLSIMAPQFLHAGNLQSNANLISMYGIFSIGIGFVIITGGIDLSVGSGMALVGVVLSMALFEWNIPMPLALMLAVAIPTLLGMVHGMLITGLRMQPFIVTLCGLLIYRGMSRYFAKDETKGYGTLQDHPFLNTLSGKLFDTVPTSLVLFIVIGVIAWFVLHRSVFGRYVMAVGRNEVAAKYSGIPTAKVITAAYMICGFLCGISGILFALYTRSISPSTHGSLYELYGIAAAVLGGCSLRGGEGSIIGIVLGAALLQVLQNLVNLMGIPSSLNFAVMGGVVLIGVMTDQIINRKKNRI